MNSSAKEMDRDDSKQSEDSPLLELNGTEGGEVAEPEVESSSGVKGVETNESSRFVDYSFATDWEAFVGDIEQGIRKLIQTLSSPSVKTDNLSSDEDRIDISYKESIFALEIRRSNDIPLMSYGVSEPSAKDDTVSPSPVVLAYCPIYQNKKKHWIESLLNYKGFYILFTKKYPKPFQTIIDNNQVINNVFVDYSINALSAFNIAVQDVWEILPSELNFPILYTYDYITKEEEVISEVTQGYSFDKGSGKKFKYEIYLYRNPQYSATSSKLKYYPYYYVDGIKKVFTKKLQQLKRMYGEEIVKGEDFVIHTTDYYEYNVLLFNQYVSKLRTTQSLVPHMTRCISPYSRLFQTYFHKICLDGSIEYTTLHLSHVQIQVNYYDKVQSSVVDNEAYSTYMLNRLPPQCFDILPVYTTSALVIGKEVGVSTRSGSNIKIEVEEKDNYCVAQEEDPIENMRWRAKNIRKVLVLFIVSSLQVIKSLELSSPSPSSVPPAPPLSPSAPPPTSFPVPTPPLSGEPPTFSGGGGGEGRDSPSPSPPRDWHVYLKDTLSTETRALLLRAGDYQAYLHSIHYIKTDMDRTEGGNGAGGRAGGGGRNNSIYIGGRGGAGGGANRGGESGKEERGREGEPPPSSEDKEVELLLSTLFSPSYEYFLSPLSSSSPSPLTAAHSVERLFRSFSFFLSFLPLRRVSSFMKAWVSFLARLQAFTEEGQGQGQGQGGGREERERVVKKILQVYPGDVVRLEDSSLPLYLQSLWSDLLPPLSFSPPSSAPLSSLSYPPLPCPATCPSLLLELLSMVFFGAHTSLHPPGPYLLQGERGGERDGESPPPLPLPRRLPPLSNALQVQLHLARKYAHSNNSSSSLSSPPSIEGGGSSLPPSPPPSSPSTPSPLPPPPPSISPLSPAGKRGGIAMRFLLLLPSLAQDMGAYRRHLPRSDLGAFLRWYGVEERLSLSSPPSPPPVSLPSALLPLFDLLVPQNEEEREEIGEKLREMWERAGAQGEAEEGRGGESLPLVFSGEKEREKAFLSLERLPLVSLLGEVLVEVCLAMGESLEREVESLFPRERGEGESTLPSSLLSPLSSLSHLCSLLLSASTSLRRDVPLPRSNNKSPLLSSFLEVISTADAVGKAVEEMEERVAKYRLFRREVEQSLPSLSSSSSSSHPLSLASLLAGRVTLSSERDSSFLSQLMREVQAGTLQGGHGFFSPDGREGGLAPYREVKMRVSYGAAGAGTGAGAGSRGREGVELAALGDRETMRIAIITEELN